MRRLSEIIVATKILYALSVNIITGFFRGIDCINTLSLHKETTFPEVQ